MSATREELAWLAWGEVGVSSATIWHVMTREPMPRGWWPNRPHDPDDLSRCVKLLDRFPAWRARLGEVAEVYPAWTELVANWTRLEFLLRWEEATSYPWALATYAVMDELQARRCLCGTFPIGEAPAGHERYSCCALGVA